MKRELKNKTDEELYYMLYEDKSKARAAFDELYARFSTKIYTYCKRILLIDELAEDVFQETFLKFYESANVDREMTNVSAFIFRIARNLCINEKQKKHHSFIDIEELTLPVENDSPDIKERAQLVDTALEALPEKFREVLVLKEFLGFSYQEIAELLGSTLPTVRINIYRAKQKIRELLAPYMEDYQE